MHNLHLLKNVGFVNLEKPAIHGVVAVQEAEISRSCLPRVVRYFKISQDHDGEF